MPNNNTSSTTQTDANDNAELQAAFASVAKQQQAFISAIFEKENSPYINEFDPKGIAVFQRDLTATAEQVLVNSFPTVLELIGEELFNYASSILLKKSPPSEGDWGLWGQDFAELLAELPELADYRFVSDVARVDFTSHLCQRTVDNQLEQNSLHLLSSVELDSLYLKLAESCFILTSDYPVIELWQAHQKNDGELDRELIEQAQYKMQQVEFKQYVLIYRTAFKTEIKALSDHEYYWLQLLKLGNSVGYALEKVTEKASDNESNIFDFGQWLGSAITDNLVNQFYVNE